MGFQCCAATSRAATPPDFLQWNPGSRNQEGGVPGCIFLPKLEDVPGSRNKRGQEHEHCQSVRVFLWHSSHAMPCPKERGGSQDRSAHPAQIHLKMHSLSAQMSGSVGKWKQFLLYLTGAPAQWHQNKNCSVPPGFSSFGNTAKHSCCCSTLFWVLVTMEQRDSVGLCSDHSSANLSLYPRRRLQFCQQKKVSGLGPY